MKSLQSKNIVVAKQPEPLAKKPWSRPQLIRLGTVAEVTAKVTSVGRNDGGSGTKKRS